MNVHLKLGYTFFEVGVPRFFRNYKPKNKIYSFLFIDEIRSVKKSATAKKKKEHLINIFFSKETALPSLFQVIKCKSSF